MAPGSLRAVTAPMGEAHRLRTDAVQALVLITLCVELTFALVAKGAFFSPESSIVLIGSLALLSVSYFRLTDWRAIRPEEVLLVLLALWWLVTARLHDVAGSFEPLGASIVAFVAAAMAVRRSPPSWRRPVSLWIVAISSTTAIVGLVACGLRWYPIAMRGQDLWRLSSTLTYSNAAGLLLAMALLIATDRSLAGWWSPIAIAACTAGLVASQSRAAVFAAVVAFAWLARHELVAAIIPIGLGTWAGLLTVASSGGDARQPVVLGATLLVLAAAPVATTSLLRFRRRLVGRSRRRSAGAIGALALVLLGAAVLAARREVARRVDLGSDLGRFHEWRAALQQFHSSIWTGVGPDRLLVLSRSEGISTYFAHNEYLQILAGGGLVAAGLLAAAIVLMARRQRTSRTSIPTSRAVLIAFAVGGCFDYTWHLPALALLAGIALGLAEPDLTDPAPA